LPQPIATRERHAGGTLTEACGLSARTTSPAFDQYGHVPVPTSTVCGMNAGGTSKTPRTTRFGRKSKTPDGVTIERQFTVGTASVNARAELAPAIRHTAMAPTTRTLIYTSG
jgi:hypothetical protein